MCGLQISWEVDNRRRFGRGKTMTKMAEVESKSEALLIYSVGWLWAGCGLVQREIVGLI